MDLVKFQPQPVSLPGVLYARATFVMTHPSRYDRDTNTLTELPEKCTGLRIGSLHSRLSCHYLKREPPDEGRTFIVTISNPVVRAQLPLCPKCCGRITI